MSWFQRLRGTFSDTDREFDEERRFHIEARTDEYVARGMRPDEARRAALRRFGNRVLAAERTRDADTLPWLRDLVRDVRFALRMLWRSRALSALAILCLSVAIGANASVLGWIEGILVRPYPLVVDEDRLVAVVGTERGTAGHVSVSWPDWLDFQRASRLAESFIGDRITGTTLSVGDRAERTAGSIVSANYFEALGIRPALGRGFLPGEDVGRNAHPVTVIAYQLWQDRFHGDPGAIGQTQMLAGLPHTIVGVAPQGFYGTFVGYSVRFWVPASMQARFDGGYKLEDRGERWLEPYVRLKPGVTIAQAQAEFSAIAARLEAAYPETNRGIGVRLYPLWQTPFNGAARMRPTLSVALVVALTVLLIACANVGNLLLVRAFARQQELTIRLSVGAGRRRVVKQLMTEGVVLAALAATGGLVLAGWMRDALAWLMDQPGGLVLRFPGMLDWRVLGASAMVCVVATLVFALAPALVASDIDLSEALRSQSGAVAGGASRTWVRSTLVVLQVSLSFVLIVGTALLIRSLQAMRHASPGFSADRVLTTAADLSSAGYDPGRARAFQDALADRIRRLAGVEDVAMSRVTPFSFRTYSSAAVSIEGFDAPAGQQPSADFNQVSPGFFATMAIPIVSGRGFTPGDDERSDPVAIVDETMAAQFWRGADPVGGTFGAGDRTLRVIGVARNAKYRNLFETPRPFFYVPLRQDFSPTFALHIRTREPPAALEPALVHEIHAIDPGVAPFELITMREQMDRTGDTQRIATVLLVTFSAIALALAAVGLYGVMAATVSQAGRELALRMALGAQATDLRRLVLSRGLTLAAGGVAIGLAAGLGTLRLLGYLLYGVSPRDPVAFVSATAATLAASLAACIAPAWRASRTDPLRALRGC
jgi:macrolide transport system ATP-binding/permease protein